MNQEEKQVKVFMNIRKENDAIRTIDEVMRRHDKAMKDKSS